MLIAESWLRRYSASATQPQLFLCDHDGEQERWVLKLSGNVGKALAADWIGCLLAHRLEIATCDVEIAAVSREALSTAPADVQRWAKPGPSFASRELKDAIGDFPDSTVIDNADAEFLGKLYALDAWLEVLDRRKPEAVWNLLFDTSEGRLIVIDFGMSLTSAFETVPVLGADTVVVPRYPERVLIQASKNAALAACDIIDTIPDGELEELVSTVPSEWAQPDSLLKVITFLQKRRSAVRTICNQLSGD